MELKLHTVPEPQPILEELVALEPFFHRPDYGSTREEFARFMAADFWETGASGRRYSREFVLDELERRAAAPRRDVWETSDFHSREIGPETYLLTYTLLQNHTRLTRRMTIWQKVPEGWKAIYHQGTVVEGS
jgi:hypothetical protein